jgi:hypothetical protein
MNNRGARMARERGEESGNVEKKTENDQGISGKATTETG